MILRTKEERIEFLRKLEFDNHYSFYMINKDDLENDSAIIENILVGWSWGYFCRRSHCGKGNLCFLNGNGSGEIDERNNSYIRCEGRDAWEYILNYIWADNKFELQKETRLYKKAAELKDSVLAELSGY